MLVFIYFFVFKIPVKDHRYTPTEKRKTKSCSFTLNGLRVCKQIFTSTLGVTNGRVDYALNKKNQRGTSSSDKRGRKNPQQQDGRITNDPRTRFLEQIPKIYFPLFR